MLWNLGENPRQDRYCIKGAKVVCHWIYSRKATAAMIFKPGYLHKMTMNNNVPGLGTLLFCLLYALKKEFSAFLLGGS
jgi:hypothetical protein